MFLWKLSLMRSLRASGAPVTGFFLYLAMYGIMLLAREAAPSVPPHRERAGGREREREGGCDCGSSHDLENVSLARADLSRKQLRAGGGRAAAWRHANTHRRFKRLEGQRAAVVRQRTVLHRDLRNTSAARSQALHALAAARPRALHKAAVGGAMGERLRARHTCSLKPPYTFFHSEAVMNLHMTDMRGARAGRARAARTCGPWSAASCPSSARGSHCTDEVLQKEG